MAKRFFAVATIALLLGGCFGLMAGSALWSSRPPVFELDPGAADHTFAVDVPEAKRARIDAVAASLAAVDLPAALDQDASEYHKVADAWRNGRGRATATPLGSNVVNVNATVPRYRSTDTRDPLAAAAAEAMNRDVLRVAAAALDRAARRP